MKIIKIITFILIFATSFSLEAQEKEYEYWGDEYFEGTSSDTIPNMNIDSILRANYKKPVAFPKVCAGFFPQPIDNFLVNFFSDRYRWDYNKGSGFLNNKIPYFHNLFSGKEPINDLKDKIVEKEKFSNEDKYKWYEKSSEEFLNIGLNFEKSLPEIYTICVGTVGFNAQIVKLYSPISKNYYLDYYGEKKEFEECNIMNVYDRSISAGFSLKHPLYGTTIGYKNHTSASIFYYLTYGIMCNYSLATDLSSYNYILSNSDEIRYSNGEIKQKVFSSYSFSGMQKFRYSYNVGLGWCASLPNGWDLGLEIKYSIGGNPFIKGTNIKQNRLLIGSYANFITLLKIWKEIYSVFK